MNKPMDPIQLRQQLRRRSAGRVAEEVVTTKEDVAAKAKKKTKAYGERRYWEARYDDEDVTTDYDWLCDWDALAPVFERNVGGPGASVLHTGCGNSPLGFELARAGYCDRCVNVDYSAAVVDRMEAAYPSVERGPAPTSERSRSNRRRIFERRDAISIASSGRVVGARSSRTLRRWDQGDCTDMDYEDELFDVVVDKGTLDAMACHDDEKIALRRGRRYVSECFRVLAPGGVLLVASFGQPETRLKYFEGHDTAEPCDGADLEPTPTAQCNYELLKSFAALAGTARWTLGAGTPRRPAHGAAGASALGARRRRLRARWTPDLIFKVAVDCAHGRREPHCGALEFRGFVDETWWTPCCGFGYKLFHATRRLLAGRVGLSGRSYAPWAHGETPKWPPLAEARGGEGRARGARQPGGPADLLVIPEDVHWKNLLFDPAAGRGRRRGLAWPGPHVSYFQDEYFEASEFEPFRSLRLYDIDVNIPNDPWASLNRTYGPECAYMARVDEHGGVLADLRKPEHARLKRPAAIRVRDVTGIGLTDEERRDA
ncbi:methyltransferase domain-containing protein [Aureococcus anophagefferens]|nr:methyltransferase domain-containing protein [Aureococcus anophagefferens]